MTTGSNPTGGGQTAKDPSGWSTDTLKDYVERIVHESDRRYEQRFIAQEKAVHAALEAAAKAVIAAERYAEKQEEDALRWRNSANEWRSAMTDREKEFMPRAQVMSMFTDLEKRVETMFNDLEKQITDLKKYRDTTEGRVGGVSASWGYLVGAIGLAAAIIGIILAFNN